MFSVCVNAQDAAPSAPEAPSNVQLSPALEEAGDEFARIAAQTELLRAQTALLEAQRAAEEARGRLSGGVAAQAAPLLIGIFGAGDVRLAEIAVGTTARRLRVGDYVSDDFRLAQIEQGSVVLVDRLGARSRLFLNKRAPPEPLRAAGVQVTVPNASGGFPVPVEGVASDSLSPFQ
jgi:hypothetical protein